MCAIFGNKFSEQKLYKNVDECRSYWRFIGIFVSLICVHNLSYFCVAAEIPTYRIVYLEDLHDNPQWQITHKRWTVSEFGSISRVALHLESNSLFVAVNNSVIRLSADTLQKSDEVSWSLPREQSEACRKYTNDPINCSPYLVSLLVPVDRAFPTVTSNLLRTGLYACLSNGNTFECSLRQASDLRSPPKVHWIGSKQCPVDPRVRVSSTFASNRNMFVASKFAQNLSSVPAIIRIPEKAFNTDAATFVQFARTASKPNWISPDERTTFIHSFEFHNAVYFLFREPASELIEGCKRDIIVSRVGRVCLTDKGDHNGLLQSFVKATIVCPGKNEDHAGPSSFVHTVLQSVHMDHNTKTLFAAFTTPNTMPASSVLCEYYLTDLEKAFEGPFHTFLGEHTKFNNPLNCQETRRVSFTDTNLQTDSRLMYNVIRPRADQPTMMKVGTLWMHVSVDWVPQTPKSDNNLIVFTMDSEDVLTKWHLFKSEACIIEQVHMTHEWIGSGRSETIHMQLIRDQTKQHKQPTLLIVTTSSVFRIPLSRCARFGHHQQSCALMNDPYCAWNKQVNQCQELSNALENSKQLIKYETCPTAHHEKSLDVTLDGGWSSWGPWSSCQMTSNRSLHAGWLRDLTTLGTNDMKITNPLIVKHCQCRYRYCSAPYRFGSTAKACPGDSAIQLANCSLDGMWTAWSSWSGCEPECASQQPRRYPKGKRDDETDLVPLRTRQRWCTNPSPMGKLGKKCLDMGKETNVCPKSEIQCPDATLSVPQWSRWSTWSTCSAACNGGLQLRWRKCGAAGQIEQFQPPALKFDLSDEWFEKQTWELHKTVCLGQAYESRRCNTQSCPVTKVTSSWTAWYVTEGNRQKGTRERKYRVECVATIPEVDKLQATIQLQKGNCQTDATGKVHCQDLSSESKTNMESNEWSPTSESGWSEWSSCSRPCGGGTRNRWRLAVSSSSTGHSQIGGVVSDRTSEVENEEEQCNTHPCPGLWSCWTAWSKCTHPPCSVQRGEQRRYRSCLISSNAHLTDSHQLTVDQCDGGEEHSVQSRPCEVTFEELQCYSSSNMNKYDLTKRNIPTAQEQRTLPGRDNNLTTPWAEWSECVQLDGLPYGVQVRARESCDQCKSVEAKRCDTHEVVSLNEILKSAHHIRKSIRSAQTEDGKGAYGIGYAVLVGLCGAVLGVAVVLVPYLICINRTRKRDKKQDRPQHAVVRRKFTERKQNYHRNLPYIWFADTDRSVSGKAALKQMLMQRKRGMTLIEQSSVKREQCKAVAGITEQVTDRPSTLNTQATTHPRNASLTRIQALHNDHRNTIVSQCTSPLSLHEPLISWDTGAANKSKLSPILADSGLPQHDADRPGEVYSQGPLPNYDPLVNGTNAHNSNGAAKKSPPHINSPTHHNDDIIYASVPCS